MLFAAQSQYPGLSARTMHLLIIVFAVGAAGVWACVRWGSRTPAARPPRRGGTTDPGSSRRPAGGSGLVAVLPPGRTEDKRAHPRRTGWRVRVLISDADRQATPLEGVLVNRSRGGLGLTSPRPAEVGAVLSVRSVRAPADTPWARVVVRRCKPKGGHWEIGCQFEDEPSLGLLTQFG
jgi:hypothetical protein